MYARIRATMFRKRYRAALLAVAAIEAVGHNSAQSMPKQFGPSHRSEPCPHCGGPPCGGWLWFTEPNTWAEHLHLLLRCERGHGWSIATDMN